MWSRGANGVEFFWGSCLMADFDNLTEQVTSLQTKISRLEFAVLFMLVLMFLLFTLALYVRR